MNIFSEKINSENLHHGYLIVGDREVAKESLLDFLKDTVDVETIGNPDFSFSEYNTLTIDDARMLTETQGRMGFSDDSDTQTRKIFVVSTNIITDEAQNALLKVFEEPTSGTHFFILVSQNTFLPTFLSRLQVLKFESEKLESGEKILDMTVAERLAMVTKLAADISDEKKVKQDAIDLVNQIEAELYEQKNYTGLKECAFARNALFSRGAMIKMILENLMLQI